MKYNNKISKVTILSCLLLGTIANAQNFYTCVPKVSYLQSQAKSAVPDSYIQDEAKKVIRDEAWFENKFYKMTVTDQLGYAKKNINNNAFWALIESDTLGGYLSMGIYKVEVAGASGGKGGNIGIENENSPFGYRFFLGGGGGLGEVVTKIFSVKNRQFFSACIGKVGENGIDVASFGGSSGGGGGGGSAFKIGEEILVMASGGGGGGGGSSASGGGGGGAGGYGCGSGGNGNFGDCNRLLGWDGCHPGSGGSVLNPIWRVGQKGGDGYEDNVDIGGSGGVGKKPCSNGGAGGSNYSEGYSASGCGNNSGNGYVRIYKYMG